MIKYFCIFVLVIIILLLCNFLVNEKFQSTMLNIYNEPLQPCRQGNMSNGSWDSEGKCSELGGGVHQICIENIASNARGFSQNTGQSNWSDQRGNNNHCVCLGAWALYNTQQNIPNKILKCDAIPKNALSDNYVSKFSEGWNKWNGLEIDNQIIQGVESMINQCYGDNLDENKKNNLIRNYCNFAKNHNILSNRELYNTHC